ncbi:MAG: DUF2079 domain-containing protein [Moorea sp. SIO2B7]|nr:DUF2079 domain-containing protein [Moorena sp. SIO2B7]
MPQSINLLEYKRKKSIYFIAWVVGITTLVFFVFSSLRLALFRAGTDLGFFAQLLYLLSQGLPPVSSLLEGVHLIGDHAAFVLYPISLFYFIYPDIHWLLLVQAFALAAGAIPVYYLSLQQSLSINYAKAIAISYVLYPALFNINFYTEFRPETIAVPALIWAVWAIKTEHLWQFIIAIILALSCKETISLTVISFGIWLWICEKKRAYGICCIILAAIWFIIAANYIIPTFRGGYPMAGTWQYSSIGNSLSELAWKVITDPRIILSRIFLPDRLFYYFLLTLPIILGLHLRQIAAMIPALPMLLLNILADYEGQRDLIHHYSLPIFPFLFIWLIHSLGYLNKQQKRLWLSPKWLIVWSVIVFFFLAKYSYFYTRYLPQFPDTIAVRAAVNLVKPEAKVLTNSFITPHLSHRPMIKLMEGEWDLERIQTYSFDYILIALKYMGLQMSVESANDIIEKLYNSDEFTLIYQDNEVFLFAKSNSLIYDHGVKGDREVAPRGFGSRMTPIF